MSNINILAENCFIEYAREVIKDRALPNIEDGCKPIHTRCLYIANDMGLKASKPTRKSAKLTGEVMGRVHPHGDSSIYDTIVRMSQPWKMRYPLFFMQGNNGSINGDGAAASRYTECRLTPLGELMLQGINKNVVPMQLNYSGEEYEPILLPSVFPNALCNSNLGIAVGMSSNTLPHNLEEICNCIRAYNCGDKNFLKYVAGPDFPTGGVVVNPEILPLIYATGKGTIRLRSKYTIENIGGRQHIVISEIPYLITVEDKIEQKIKNMIIDEDYSLIENIQNNIGKDGFEIRIILAKNAPLDKVLEDLCKRTGFETTISVNNTFLVEGQPKLLNFEGMIKEYLRHQHTTIIRAAQFDLDKAEKRLHIVNGLLIAVQDIDNVVSIIKSSSNKNEARIGLMNRYGLDTIQADAVLDLKLSKLTTLDTKELKDEKEDLLKKIDEYNRIINNEDTRKEIINKNLEGLKKFYDKRRTQIGSIKGVAAPKSITTPPTTSNETTVQEVNLDEAIMVFNNEEQKYVIVAAQNGLNTNKLLGDLTKLKAWKIKPQTSYAIINKKGELFYKDFTFISDTNGWIEHSFGEVIQIIDKQEYIAATNIITISKNGMFKSTLVNNCKRVGTICKIKDDDELLTAFAATVDKDYLMILLDSGKMVKLSANIIPSSGRQTIGSKFVDGTIVDVALCSNDDLLFMASEEKAKVTKVSDFIDNSKGSTGQVINDGVSRICKYQNSLYYFSKKLKNKEFSSPKGKTAIGNNFESQVLIVQN